MDNYIKYAEGHWSTEDDEVKSLTKYLDMYEDVYNKENLKRILAEVPGDSKLKVLDYGGGVGIISVRLAKCGHDVTLIDAAPLALSTANFYAEQEGVKLTTICSDRFDDQVIEGDFDVIIAKDLIEHVVDDESLICSFYNKLKDGGKLIVTTQNSKSPNYVLEGAARKTLHPTVKWLGWDRTHFRFYNYKKLEKLAHIAGFRDCHFNSGYIFPYKLFSLVLPWINCRENNFMYRFDLYLMKLSWLNKYGWNIMMTCRK